MSNTSPPYYRIRSRRDTAANWMLANPVLGLGEQGYETDTQPYKWKVGDGASQWEDLPYESSGGGSSAPTIDGTRSVPIAITAIGGITALTGYNQLIYVEGSGGPVIVTANPQISPGDNDGEILELRGRDDTNYVELSDGNGLSLNGSVFLQADCSITLRWDTVNWVEIARRDN